MANIKYLQMWNGLCTDSRISISKSLLGLRTNVVYNLTNSIVDARTIEFSSTDGERLKNILCSPNDNLAQAINGFLPKPVANGNYLAEVCKSRDGEFIAVMLLQFIHLSYESMTDVLIFEGNDARTVAKLF